MPLFFFKIIYFIKKSFTIKKDIKKISNKNKIDTLILNYGIDYIEGNSYFFNRRTIPFNNISISNLKSLEKLEDTLTPGFLYGNEKKYEKPRIKAPD